MPVQVRHNLKFLLSVSSLVSVMCNLLDSVDYFSELLNLCCCGSLSLIHTNFFLLFLPILRWQKAHFKKDNELQKWAFWHTQQKPFSLLVYTAYFVPAGFSPFAFLIYVEPLCGQTCLLLMFTDCPQDYSPFSHVGRRVLAFPKKLSCSFLSEGVIRTYYSEKEQGKHGIIVKQHPFLARLLAMQNES